MSFSLDNQAVAPEGRMTDRIVVSPTQVGAVMPLTFLERWGVVFVGWAGAWVLTVGLVVLGYYLLHPPLPPSVAGMTTEQMVEMQRRMYEQWRESVTFIFDLLVTKTVLPIVTLLLGYLFGRSKTESV